MVREIENVDVETQGSTCMTMVAKLGAGRTVTFLAGQTMLALCGLIDGLLREGRLEAQGDQIRRAKGGAA